MAESKRTLTERARVSEVFNMYVKYSGDLSKFASELAKKYGEEDGFTYTHNKILNYLKVTLDKKSLDKASKEAIHNIEVKKGKRMLAKGRDIYALFKECNGDWELIQEKLSEHPTLTDENNGNMLTVVGLKRYMKMYNDTIRPKEVFDAYMANNGDFSLFINELLERYSFEDGEEYTTSKITKYLKQYLNSRRLFKEEKEQMENIDLLNRKRLLDIGEIIYFTFLKHNFNFDLVVKELENNPRIVDVYSNEQLDRAGMMKYMKEYMNYMRPKEVFDEYVEHKGRFYQFSEALEIRYAKEDGNDKPYTVAKIQNYLNTYLEDTARFEAEEKKRYNETLIEIVKRRYISGGKFIEGFIHFNGDYNKVMEFFTNRPKDVDYFRDDVTGNIVTKPVMFDNVDCYLKKPNNIDRVNNYNIVRRLNISTALKDFGIKAFNQLIDLFKSSASFETIREFTDSHNLNRDHIRNIRNIYASTENPERDVIESLDEFIKVAFKAQPKERTGLSDKQTAYLENSRLNKLECLKKLLEHYIQSDERRITQVLMEQYDLTPGKFDKALALASETTDVQLRSLLDKYYAKVNYIESENREILDRLNKYLTVGYIVNGEFSKLNTYDFYKEFGNVDLNELKKSCYKYYRVAAAERIVKWLRFVFNGQRIYKTPEELAREVDFKTNGLSLNDEEKLVAAKYMESMGWPLSSVVYTDFIYRLLCGQVSLDMEDTKENTKTK